MSNCQDFKQQATWDAVLHNKTWLTLIKLPLSRKSWASRCGAEGGFRTKNRRAGYWQRSWGWSSAPVGAAGTGVGLGREKAAGLGRLVRQPTDRVLSAAAIA